MTTAASRVLVVAPNWIGDAVMALPAVADIRRHFAGGQVIVAARRGVAELFGLSPLTLRRIKTDHLGAPADDPYVVLGVAPDASDEQVCRAWRGLLSAAHPDRALGSGRPEAEVAAAHRRSAQLNAAYAKVMRERHELVGAEGA